MNPKHKHIIEAVAEGRTGESVEVEVVDSLVHEGVECFDEIAEWLVQFGSSHPIQTQH